jgi:hypothetical protein
VDARLIARSLRPGDFLAVVGLDLVTDLEIVEPIETETALVPGLNFAHVVLEALE